MSKATTGTARNDVNVSEIAATSEVSRLLAEDTTPWYRKKNLRRLYMFLIPSALGVEITTGTILPATPPTWRCQANPLPQASTAAF